MATTVVLPIPAIEAPQKSSMRVTGHKVNNSPWPRDLLEAHARICGPYTVENAEALLEEEAVEIYNGWLVRQEMTHFIERRVMSNVQTMLDLSARNLGFGQAIPDQAECLLSNGDVVKPDASLISWQRLRGAIFYTGPNQRPLLQGGPELVIEARSPSNRRAQEKTKRGFYFASKVQIIWDVDEKRKTVWVYRAESPDIAVRFGIGDEIDCEPLLPGWRRRIADIFAEETSAEAVAGEVAVQWRAEGKVIGIKEGKAIGIEEGEARALRQMLPMLVKFRFGESPPMELVARLESCSLAQLQQLQRGVETAASLSAWSALLPER